MDTQNAGITPDNPSTNNSLNEYPSNRSGRALGGLVVVAIGAVLLAKQAGVDLPSWLFTWEMFLIALGVFIGAKHSFRDWGWLILVAVGMVFLMDDFIDDISLKQFFWPVIIIIIGLAMIFKPRKRHNVEHWKHWSKHHPVNEHHAGEDSIDSVTIFGGVKKNIISKSFKGGESVTVFGGTELNLLQADGAGKIELELVQVFGGTKLIVPAHWKIHAEELVSIFGGLNDKRPVPGEITQDQDKVIILKGVCLFGGIDIKSY